MSTESVKGSNDDALTSGSDPAGSPRSGTDQRPKSVGDSDGESKIKADVEEHEKKGSPETPTKSGSRSDGTEGENGRKSRSPGRTSRQGSAKVLGSPPRSSDSRPKSSTSGEVMFEAKSRKKPKKGAQDEDGHEVTFTVTISVAVPTDFVQPPLHGRQENEWQAAQQSHHLADTVIEVEDEDQPDIHELVKKRKRVFEAPRAQNYYHVEYYLVPDPDELMKTDVVTYGMGAKIYMERNEPLIKKTWHDGEVTWIAWSQRHKLFVTKDLLLKLYNHTLELRIWDTKDKVGQKAKFDRPKLFKLPQFRQGDDVDDLGGVKSIVTNQSKSFTDMQPKKSRDIRALPKEVTYQKNENAKKREGTPGADKPGSRASGDKLSGPQGATSPTPHTLVAVPNRDEDDGRSSFSRLGRLAGQDEGGGRGFDSRASKVSSRKSHTVSQTSRVRTDNSATPTSKLRQGNKSAASSGSSKVQQMSHVGSQPPRRRNRKALQAAQLAAENIKKNGICMVPIRMAVLFAGLETVTNRLEKPVPGVEDMFVTLHLNKPLLDEKQKLELNPMIIKLHSATNMPSSPMSLDSMKEKCFPVYCKYKFFNLQQHLTLKRTHADNVYWDDINVILAGTFEPSEFRQYLNGPPLEVEVHDRDRKAEEMKLKATLFGDDLEDEKISNVGTIASRRTLHNPFKDKWKVWDPYGVARVDLSDLLLGQKFMYIKVPVHNCALPDLLGLADTGAAGAEGAGGGRMMGLAGAVDGPVEGPMPAGHYVASHTMLKIKVELTHPLTTPETVAAKEHIDTTIQCPFGRIVFKLDYKNTIVLNKLQSLVTTINARALELDDMPQHVIDAALSTYKLSAAQQQSRTLDIITGFQVLDGRMHLFVLEGLRDHAIHEVWHSLPQPENSDVEVLYNSNLCFSNRLYGPLDVDLCRIKLHEPLAQIVQQPLLYVRDMVPKPCFEALVRLHELTKTKNARGAVRNELFPSADMVVSMSKEFGIPFTTDDFEELQMREEKSFVAEATTTREQSFYEGDMRRYWEPIDNMNLTYMEKLLEREEREHKRDFLKEHKTQVKKASDVNKREKDMNKPLTVKADVAVAHNYSSQSLNSTEQAREKLREMLAKDPDTRYTYCQDYLHSMTVVPVNVEALKKQEAVESQARWKTKDGWIFPGMKTTLEANENPKKPHYARMDELEETWRENILHVGLLQAPLDRDRLPWDIRNTDMELYRKPQPNFGTADPNTIHLAGEKLRQEKLASQRRDYEEWNSKIKVADARQYFHRCLPETEMLSQGRQASNQVARQSGLLKDTPKKVALSRPGMNLKNIPPLNVVLNPSVDTDARLAGEPTLPAVENEGDESNNGFKPGPFINSSWVMEKNKIPAINYEHMKFNKTKGHDFNVYHKERMKMWKRPIVPLHDDERDNHLFRIPDDPKRFGVLPGLSPDLERANTLPNISSLSMISPPTTEQPIAQLTSLKMSIEPSRVVSAQPGKVLTLVN